MKRMMIALVLTLLTGCVVAPMPPDGVVVHGPPPHVAPEAVYVPPAIVFQAPPVVIVMPDTDNVYVVPDISDDLFFWNGFWWRLHDGLWYRSQYYDRGWGYYNNVPSFYYDIDSGWRDTTETGIGTDIGGTMNGFLADNLSRIGRAGKIIDIGKAKEAGEYKAISLGPNNRGRK